MILITRPIDKALILKHKLSKHGYKCHVEPLSEIKVKNRNILIKTRYTYLVSSPRVIEYIIKHQSKNLKIKLLVIGLSSFDKLKQAGFKNLIYGAQDSDDMIKFLKKSNIKFINYLTGTVRNKNLSIRICKLGISLIEDIIYVTTFKKALSNECISLIKSKKIKQVLIYSKANAQHFINLISKANIEKESKSLVFLCLSKKIATLLKFRGYVAEHSVTPTETGMIKKLTIIH